MSTDCKKIAYLEKRKHVGGINLKILRMGEIRVWFAPVVLQQSDDHVAGIVAEALLEGSVGGEAGGRAEVLAAGHVVVGGESGFF